MPSAIVPDAADSAALDMKMKDILKKGQVIHCTDDYTVTNIINSVDYNQVYRVERVSDKKPHLLKLYVDGLMPEELKFGDEPKLTRYLGTSDIARYLGVKNWDTYVAEDGTECHFVISRYFKKGVLSDKLKVDGRLKPVDAVKVIYDISEALSMMKGYSVNNEETYRFCHCDINPDNIMYDCDENGDLRAYLIDIDHISHIPGDGKIVTWEDDIEPLYSGTETFPMEGGRCPASDVFSLGVVFYQCLYGELPWKMNMEIYDSCDVPKKRGYVRRARSESGDEPAFHDDMFYRIYRFCLDGNVSVRMDMARLYCHMKALYFALKEAGDDMFLAWELYDGYYEKFSKVSDHDVYGTPASGGTEGGGSEEKEEEDPDRILNEELGYRALVHPPRKGGGGFADIAGMNGLKEYLKNRIIYFIANPELAAEYNITLPNGIMFYGPPGCGKSFFARKFAEETGFNFAFIKASDLGSTYVHGSQGKINELFKEARAKAPCILCFDEFDAFVPDRSKVTNSNHSGEVNEFLSQLNDCGKDRVFIIATTNNPEGIDPAVTRSGRIDTSVYIPVPDFEARRAILMLSMKKRPCAGDIDYDELARLTEGYVSSDLTYIANDAAMNAAYSRKRISHQILLNAIQNTKPSVSRKVLEEHEAIRKRMESGSGTETCRKIGFK